MIRVSAAVLCILAVSGCTSVSVRPGGPVLISAQTPPNANAGGNNEPQPPNSLPPGAEGMGKGPNARQPSYGALTIRSPTL